MAQPSTIDKTFDTSLIDIQRSFSSTETNTSGSSGKENVKPDANTNTEDADLTPRLPTSELVPKDLTTEDLYDQWASTYDTDGNVLQACDDLYFPDLLSRLDELVCANAVAGATLRILDLGCGTGRNTLKLLHAPWKWNVDIVGWDSSRAMLQLATKKCSPLQAQRANSVGLEFEQTDLLNIPSTHSNTFDAIISTLVLEHLPAPTFFAQLSRLLKQEGVAVVTNMHPDMGRLSRGAGFKTPSGERVRGVTHVHTVGEAVAAAREAGLELLGEVEEKELTSMGEDLVVGMDVREEVRRRVIERARKWDGVQIWFGMLLRKV